MATSQRCEVVRLSVKGQNFGVPLLCCTAFDNDSSVDNVSSGCVSAVSVFPISIAHDSKTERKVQKQCKARKKRTKTVRTRRVGILAGHEITRRAVRETAEWSPSPILSSRKCAVRPQTTKDNGESSSTWILLPLPGPQKWCEESIFLPHLIPPGFPPFLLNQLTRRCHSPRTTCPQYPHRNCHQTKININSSSTIISIPRQHQQEKTTNEAKQQHPLNKRQ